METVPVMPVSEKPPPSGGLEAALPVHDESKCLQAHVESKGAAKDLLRRRQDAEISGMAMLWWCAAKQIGARWATSSRYGQPGMRKSHEPNPESSNWGDAPSSRPS